LRQFAISDIHGHLKTFQALLKRIDFTVHDELYLLGDFIDRGPDSKGVIDHIEELRATGRIVVHGHTPVARTDIEQSVASLEYLPVINIDNGCFAPASGGMHNLCALELGTHLLTSQENTG
jgi:fructose-1,6-bisphosphatase